MKQQGLDELLVYDRHPRKALVDHFYPVDVTLDDLVAGREVECGDFVAAAPTWRRSSASRGGSRVVMERPGRAGGHTIRIRKTIELWAGSPDLAVSYLLEDLPGGECLHFAVEINLAAMAGHAPDRYYTDPSGARLGMLDARLDLPHASGLNLTDEWLDLSVALGWSQAAGRLVLPHPDRQPSEGGIEGVYQSSAVIPHWHVTADEHGRWEVRIRIGLGPGPARPPASRPSPEPGPTSSPGRRR